MQKSRHSVSILYISSRHIISVPINLHAIIHSVHVKSSLLIIFNPTHEIVPCNAYGGYNRVKSHCGDFINQCFKAWIKKYI